MAFSLTSLIPGVGYEYAHVATTAIVGAGVLTAAFVARTQLGSGEQSVNPAKSFSLRFLFEMITEFIQNLCTMVIGEHGKTYVPLFAAVFTFILASNLVGLIPGMSPATENINTTIGMGLLVFLYYNFLGLKENGTHYLKHFLGPVLWLAPLILVIEIISHVVRPISLGLRLANVIKGDHTVVAIFLDLVPVLIPVAFLMLGIFVAFVQAFVFTLLSMVYVALATAHDH